MQALHELFRQGMILSLILVKEQYVCGPDNVYVEANDYNALAKAMAKA